jgi:hypothetical protein
MIDLTITDAEELALIQEHREKKAAEQRLAEAWAQVFGELNEAAHTGVGAWTSAGKRFLDRAAAVGWDAETDHFLEGLLKARGWREEHVRGRGYVWVWRPKAAPED